MRKPLAPRALSLSVAGFAVAAAAAGVRGAPPIPPDAPLPDRAAWALGLRACDVVTPTVAGTPAEGVVALLPLPAGPVLLDLRPASVRSAGYRLLVQGADGALRSVEPATPTTLRGTVIGDPHAGTVAASLTGDGLVARVFLDDGEEWWLEPVPAEAGAAAGEHALYRAADVQDHGGTCAAQAALRILPQAAGGDGGTTATATASAGELKIAELACDADYEYFQAWGSVTAVEDRISSVINTVNLQYENEVGISHQLSAIVVRAAEPDPYSSTDASTLLNQFRNHWNANHGDIQRDVAQLFTGKEVNSSTIGIAWLSAVCTSYGYGVVQSDFNGNFSCATDLSAHELGHNWAADHCSCTSNTMNPYITCANTFHELDTRPEIVAFRDSLSCLADSTPTDPTGACCVGDACSVETSADCSASGGVYLGDGTDCSASPCATGGDVVNLAVADHATTGGSIASGTFATTHDQDDVAQVLLEEHTGGRPSQRRSLLSHTWRFEVAAGESYAFFVDAWRDANAEGDDFVFSYSLDGAVYTPLVTIDRDADDDVLDTIPFGEDVAGTVFVRVEDTDRTTGHGDRQAVYVDEMFILTGGEPDLDPPAAPTGLTAVAGTGAVTLFWDDNVESDLAGYAVYRALAAGGPYSEISGALVGVSEYLDEAVDGGTTYFYVVTAVDLAGNESAASNEASATPDGPAGPTSMHVAGIAAWTVNVSGPWRRGRAEITVVDDLGEPVSGAVVSASFSGAFAEAASAVTGAGGVAVLETAGTVKGNKSFTVCVDDVAGTLAYDASANVETCDGN